MKAIWFLLYIFAVKFPESRLLIAVLTNFLDNELHNPLYHNMLSAPIARHIV